MAIPIINVSILNGSNGFRLDGERGFEYGDSGRSVSSAGDINGDGFDDVMIGAFYTYPDAIPEGNSYVILGKAGGFNAVENLASLDGNNGFRFGDGSFASPFLVSDAGDINGDGFDDVIIGAPGFYDYYDNPRDHPGAGYVVFGRSSDFAADNNLSNLKGNDGFRLNVGESLSVEVSSAGDVNGDGFDDVIIGAQGAGYVMFGQASGFDATFDLSSLDGNNGFRLDGANGSDRAGNLVSGAGDVNGDGFDDVLIITKYSSESSYLVFGRASGFAAAMDLSSLDGNNGFQLNGLGSASKSISSAGDINGDGFDDIIVGAYNADLNGTESGSSYVVFGKASGFSAAMDLTTLDGHNGFRVDGFEPYDHFGMSVSSAGDVNDDGFDDVIIGAPRARNFNDDPIGVSYVVFGRASGFDAVLDLSSLEGTSGFRLEGNGGEFGSSVSSAGDVNNDGVNDLIIGAPDVVPSGASYVVFGGSFLNEAVYRGTSGQDFLVGTILAERFEAGDGNDFINGLGGADIFQGDAGDDTIVVPDLNFQQVDGGIGSDTLKLVGEGIRLNLAGFQNTIDGIEMIDLTGSGSNTLTLTLPDLLSLSDTTDTFTVNGNADDRVVGLVDGWTDGGFDGNYRIFTNNETVLRVDRAVRTDVTDVPMAGVIILADLDGSNGFRLNGAGRPVSSAGDVNGDGFDDVIVGAHYADPNGNYSGSSYVVFGKSTGFDATMDLSGLNGNSGFRLDGEAERDKAGYSVSTAGDVNGDGFDDVIVGAPHASPNGSGSSYVVFGKASDFDATMDLSGLNGNNGFRLDGEAEIDRAGYSVSTAGDVNGDGFDDVIVGAHSHFVDPNGNFSGSSYVVFGKSTGFDATMDLSSLNGNNGFRLGGEAERDKAGYSVSTAGDVNGDGFDDVIIGASDADLNGIRSSSSYVVFGKESGFAATLDLSSLNGSNGFRMDGEAANDLSGFSVSNAGDVNGDGFDDVIIGAYGADLNGIRSGSSYVVFGKASGFSATLDLSSLNGSNGFRLDGATTADDQSGFSVDSAGDVNGDGFDDLIVGVPGVDSSNYGDNAGASYVVFGKASGFSAAMDLSSLDGSNGIRLVGVEAGKRSGDSVSSAGDVNGDGFDDLIVGAYDDGRFAVDSASSYVIFGSRDFGGGGGNVIQGTPGDDVLKGTSAADIFEAGDGSDLMIGRGGADIFKAGADNDKITVTDLDFASVDGGVGNDVLHLAGNGLNLNLADFGGDISGVETFCLFGKGDNTLTLTAADLLNLSDTSNTLKVNGNAAGHIIVEDSGWVDGGSRGSGYYHVYTNDEAVLLVGQNITIDFV